jgi:two-component sensor histidine kinase
MILSGRKSSSPQPQLLTLKQLLLEQFAPYGEDRLEAFGPEIFIQPEAARYLILLIHELVTNAAKYGSLSRLSGRVLVEWQEEQETILLKWKESGGPRIGLPKSEGFGSHLAAACLKAVSGSMQQDFAPDGFSCSIKFKGAALGFS